MPYVALRDMDLGTPEGETISVKTGEEIPGFQHFANRDALLATRYVELLPDDVLRERRKQESTKSPTRSRSRAKEE